MTDKLEELRVAQYKLISQHEHWQEACESVHMILNCKDLFNGPELERAKQARYKIHEKIAQIEEAMKQNDRQKRLFVLEQIEAELNE